LMAITVSCGAEVLAASSHCDGVNTVVRLVTEHGDRTIRALTDAGFNCQSDPVVLVELRDEPGLPALMAAKLAVAGIRVRQSYASHSDDHRAHVVFQTIDDDRAIRFLNVEALIRALAAAKRRRPAPEMETAEAYAEAHAA
jgi:hypothetical protein